MQLTTVVSTLALASSVLAAENADQQQQGQQTDVTKSQGMKPAEATGMPQTMTTKAKDETKPTSAAAKPTGKSKDAGAMTHTVMVSDEKGTLKFTPQMVQADVGHMVEFMFHPMNHSVAQAAYDKPCEPMAAAMPGMNGFYSGFMPVSGKESKKFTVMVNSTQPMWFYCSQAEHCQKGMVGAINPPAAQASGQSMQGFMDGAKKAPKNVSPSVVAGGCDDKKKMHGSSGKAKGSGMAKPTGGKKTKASGVAKPSGGAKAKTTSPASAAAAGNATSPTSPAAAGAAGAAAAISSAPAAASAAGAASPAGAAAAAAANSSAPVKSANAAPGGSADFISSSSPISLIGLLAAGFYLYA